MSIADLYVKGKIKPEGEVVFTDGAGKVILRCIVPYKPKEAMKRLKSLFDNMEKEKAVSALIANETTLLQGATNE